MDSTLLDLAVRLRAAWCRGGRFDDCEAGGGPPAAPMEQNGETRARWLAIAAEALAAVVAEREACAKALDEEAAIVREAEFFGGREGAETLRRLAAAIRARR